jgi:hypothetical protein
MTPFTGNVEDLYFRYDEDRNCCLDFVEAFSKNKWLQSLYWPNKLKAPWHLQMKVNGRLINFWPHRMKAHVAEESGSAHTIAQIVATVRRIEKEADEDFDVVEKDE